MVVASHFKGLSMEQKILPVYQVVITALLMVLTIKLFPSFYYTFPFKFLIFSLLIFLAFLIAFIAVYSFRKHKTTVNPTKPETTSKIIQTGPYSFSRNPMYLALLIVLIAVGVLCENSLAFVPLPLFVWFITTYQIKPEEKALTKYFGEEYKQYLLNVRRWV